MSPIFSASVRADRESDMIVRWRETPLLKNNAALLRNSVVADDKTYVIVKKALFSHKFIGFRRLPSLGMSIRICLFTKFLWFQVLHVHVRVETRLDRASFDDYIHTRTDT